MNTGKVQSASRRWAPAGSLLFLAKELEEAEAESPGELRAVARRAAYALRVLAAGVGDD